MSEVQSIHAAQPGSPAPSGPPRTVSALIQSIESMFHCVQGPAYAYFELRTAAAPDAPVMRGVYSTLKFAAQGRRADVEAMLVQAVDDEFKAMLAKYTARFNYHEHRADGLKPFLFWRRIPEIEEYLPEREGIDANGSWVEGRLYPLTVVRCRFFIEGLESYNEPGPGVGMVYLREVC